jgi:hypothetical protein
MNNVLIKKRFVNSKPLFVEINDFIETGLLTPGISWNTEIHRHSFVEVMGDWLSEFKEEGKITQFDVIADHRINSTYDKDKFNVVVKYKQKHCLNTTIIEYTVIESENEEIDELLDWMLYP